MDRPPRADPNAFRLSRLAPFGLSLSKALPGLSLSKAHPNMFK
jgi:hypothetical protein